MSVLLLLKTKHPAVVTILGKWHNYRNNHFFGDEKQPAGKHCICVNDLSDSSSDNQLFLLLGTVTGMRELVTLLSQSVLNRMREIHVHFTILINI